MILDQCPGILDALVHEASLYPSGASVHAIEDSPVTEKHPVQILHFPIRSYSQFLTKIRQGAEAAQRNVRLTSDICGNWRFLYKDYYLRGCLPDYYRGQILDRKAVQAGIPEEWLVADERLLACMRKIAGRRVSPE